MVDYLEFVCFFSYQFLRDSSDVATQLSYFQAKLAL